MPHYADGTAAEIGDTIRGKGYNIKDERGELAEITGTLVHVDPNATACNVIVALVEVGDIPSNPPAAMHLGRAGAIPVSNGHKVAQLRLEYGQTDHFVKV